MIDRGEPLSPQHLARAASDADTPVPTGSGKQRRTRWPVAVAAAFAAIAISFAVFATSCSTPDDSTKSPSDVTVHTFAVGSEYAVTGTVTAVSTGRLPTSAPPPSSENP